ncbi:hypothetical protein V6N12_030974 [Hibiscus sabdariffa]|uniref:Uncharacterized protein n=1 Tax=Hibiscus sabdariffa TaxID=183260 RepID=A0ABR2EB43_9ROSI
MWLPRVVDWTEQDYVLDCLRFEFRCLGYWFTHGPVTILNAWCCIGAWMRDLNSMSEESVSVREEERSDWEDAIGQDNHVVESRDAGAFDVLVPTVWDVEQLVDGVMNCDGPLCGGL